MKVINNIVVSDSVNFIRPFITKNTFFESKIIIQTVYETKDTGNFTSMDKNDSQYINLLDQKKQNKKWNRV